MRILIVIIIWMLVPSCAVRGSNDLYKSQSPTSWEDVANSECKMAVPDILVNQQDLSVDINFSVRNKGLWIGYFKMMTIFEYKGCKQVFPDDKSFNLTLQHNAPGLCYTKCKYKDIVGVSLDKCFCLDSLENTDVFETKCNTKCKSNENGLLCGGQGYMSLYRVNKDENVSSTGISEATDCLWFEYSGQASMFKWSTCQPDLLVLCDNNSVPIHIDETYADWALSVGRCINMELFPSSYQSLRPIQNFVAPSWSGVVKSDVFYTIKEWRNDYQASTDVQFGYVNKTSYLNFDTNANSRRAICNKTNEESTVSSLTAESTVTEQTQTKSSTFVSTLVTSKNPPTARPTKMYSSTATPSIITGNSQDILSSTTTSNGPINYNEGASTQDNGQNLGVPVGISVSAIVIVIIVVVLFIIFKKRGMIPELCKQAAQTTSSDTSTKESNKTYIQQHDAHTVNKYVYNDMPYSSQEINIQTNKSDYNQAGDYFVLEPHAKEIEPRHTGGQFSSQSDDTYNVYNEINHEQESEYNHTFDAKIDVDTVNDYDTAATATQKISGGGHQTHSDESDNDTYNHIGIRAQNRCHTDNTYGLHGQYGNDTPRKGNDMEESDDYSHINSKPANLKESELDNGYSSLQKRVNPDI